MFSVKPFQFYTLFFVLCTQFNGISILSAQELGYDVPCLSGQVLVDLRQENELINNVNDLSIDINEIEGTCDWIGLLKSNGCTPFSRCSTLCTPNNTYNIYPYDPPTADYIYYTNGVDFADLTAIANFIFFGGFTEYQKIAADASKSNCISTFDIVEIRKLILGIYQDYPSNSSWRYVDRTHVFPPPTNYSCISTPFPESVNVIGPPIGNLGIARFIAVKIGDVNGSAIPCEFLASTPNVDLIKRYTESNNVKVELSSSQIDKFGNFKVFVKSDSKTPLIGLQLGLKYDSDIAELIDISLGKTVTEDCFGTTDKNGELKFIWVAFSPSDLMQEGQNIFTLEFKANKHFTSVANFISLDSGVLENRSADKDLNEFSVSLKESDIISHDDVYNAVCSPNPSNGSLTLSFKSNVEDTGEIIINSIDGKNIFFKEISIQKGTNETSLNIQTFPPGIYVWRLKSNYSSLSGQIVKL